MTVSSGPLSVSSNSTLSPVPDTAFIATGEDAAAYINQMILDYFKSFSQYLYEKFASQNGIHMRISSLSFLQSQLSSEKIKILSPATVSSLKASSNSYEDLAKVFNNSAYRLGDSLDESKEVLAEMDAFGFDISARVEYPIYAQEFDKDNNLKSESVLSIDDSLRKLLANMYLAVPSKDYVGANQIEINFNDGGKYKFVVFDQFANLKISEADLANAIPQCKNLLETLINDVSEFLKKSLESINALKVPQDQLNEIIKSNKKISEDLAGQKIADVSEVVRKIRILFHDRRLADAAKENSHEANSFLRNSAKNISPIFKNEIYKVMDAHSVGEISASEKGNILSKILFNSGLIVRQ